MSKRCRTPFPVSPASGEQSFVLVRWSRIQLDDSTRKAGCTVIAALNTGFMIKE
ncbi:MAG: hypothetical protein U9R47_09250 [Actinomycetota bacterium]|nr:hypothetical protein [Actinomycetota bacterium]